VEEAGFTGYLRKPLDPTKFVDNLLEVLRNIPDIDDTLREQITRLAN